MKVEIEHLNQNSAVVKMIDGQLSWTLSVMAPRPPGERVQREVITLERTRGHDTRKVNVSLL